MWTGFIGAEMVGFGDPSMLVTSFEKPLFFLALTPVVFPSSDKRGLGLAVPF
jgi:hypothetical protein